MADTLNVNPAAVAMMLRKLRREGVTEEEGKMLDEVFESLVNKSEEDEANTTNDNPDWADPKVIILKRQRR